jgi:hypothetical protein
MDSLGETELQSTYIDPVLTPLLSNPQQNVVLRWANKNEEVSDIRPDAVISTIIQSKYGRPLGFGEVKPGNSSTNKHSLCMDTLRLATLSKDTIDRYSQDICFAFQVNGMHQQQKKKKKTDHQLFRLPDIVFHGIQATPRFVYHGGSSDICLP